MLNEQKKSSKVWVAQTNVQHELDVLEICTLMVVELIWQGFAPHASDVLYTKRQMYIKRYEATCSLSLSL